MENSNSSINQDIKAKFVGREVLTCFSYEMQEVMEKEILSYEDVENSYQQGCPSCGSQEVLKMKIPTSTITKKQVKTLDKTIKFEGSNEPMRVKIRHDDHCGNGHNSFSITGEIGRSRNNPIMCGCIHEEIAKHFPELKPFIKWHLCSTDEPMHYLSNTLYNASNKDCWGKTKGEPRHYAKLLYFGDFPIMQKIDKNLLTFIEENELLNAVDFWRDTEILEVQHKTESGGWKFSPKYQLISQEPLEWYQCPFDTGQEAFEFIAAMKQGHARIEKVPTSWGEGKEPDLEAARNSAIWPKATLEQLQNKELLIERLPALMNEFKKDVESLGLIY